MNEWLREGERIDDLQRDGLLIIQNPGWFCFGMDAVLLSAFASCDKGDRCLDMCTGNGVVPILMSARYEGSCFHGIEIQSDIASMAERSVKMNRIEDKVVIFNDDVKRAPELFGAATYDVITCNPPYLAEDGGLINPADHKAIARHEICLKLEELIDSVSRVLVPGGHFYMVHRPFRLAEALSLMVEKKIEPKRMRMVYPYADREPNMVLIEGVRGGRSGMICEKPLVVYLENGDYTPEIRELYEN